MCLNSRGQSFCKKLQKLKQIRWFGAAKYKQLKDKRSIQDTTATTTTVTTTGTGQRKPKSAAPTTVTRPQKTVTQPATTAVIPTTTKTVTSTTGDSTSTVVTSGAKPRRKI